MGQEIVPVEYAPEDAVSEADDRIERLIWRYAGVKSVRQIAEATGLDPDAVLRIRKRMKEEIDVLSIEEKQHKILVSLEEIMDKVKAQIDNVSDERNYAGIVNAFVNASKTFSVEMRALEKKNSGAVESLNALRVRELLRLIDTAVSGTLDEVAETHDLDRDELQGVFQSHLRPAAEELEGS